MDWKRAAASRPFVRIIFVRFLRMCDGKSPDDAREHEGWERDYEIVFDTS